MKRLISLISKPVMAGAAVLLLMVSAGCRTATPQPVELPEPTTPVSTATPTPTIVWFPPTATYTPFPTPAVTPTEILSPLSGDLIFSDTFTEPTLWALGQTTQTSIALGMEKLTLAMDKPEGYLYSLRQQTELDDFYLEITASPSLCKGADEYGLLLRVSPALEFYRFSLTCDGHLRLDKYFQGKASSPQPPILSGAVPPGAPSSSRLGVWASGREMRFYVNGEFQFSVRDPSLPSGGLGVFIRSAGDNAVTVSFSDLQVYHLPE